MLNCPEDKRNALHKQVQRFNLVLLDEVYTYLFTVLNITGFGGFFACRFVISFIKISFRFFHLGSMIIVPLKHFYSNRVVTITGEGMQILTYNQKFKPLGIKGSLRSHTYRDTEHLFI